MLICYLMEEVEKTTSHDIAMVFGMQCRSVRKRMLMDYNPGSHIFNVQHSMGSLASLGRTFEQEIDCSWPDDDTKHLHDITTWIFILSIGRMPDKVICVSSLLANITLMYIAYIGHYAWHADLRTIVSVFEEILNEPTTLDLQCLRGQGPPSSETIH